MNVGYPNASDRAISRGDPGGAIMIHGSCASIGCLSMTDERVEELWTMATAVHSPDRKVHVHIFPTRAWDDVLAEEGYAEHRRFWRNLREGYDAFEKTHRRPKVSIDWQGRYVVPMPPQPGLAANRTR
jgi:murein L,D-transpeptidase YafK